LARSGVKELMLIAQELTYYGLDIYKKRSLPRLLDALCEVEGIDWIRLHYAYPTKFPMNVLDVIAKQPKICNYLDIPLQHAHDDVLFRMKRQITRKEMQKLIDEARRIVPDIALRTTFMVGFPGETEEEFETLCNFVRKNRFERMGVFQYSHEEDTSAYLLDDDIPKEIKAERANKLMEIQQDISVSQNEQLIGSTLRVLFDRKEGGYFIGRTEADSPEVDNEVLVSAALSYTRLGDFRNVVITEVQEFDLFGEFAGKGI